VESPDTTTYRLKKKVTPIELGDIDMSRSSDAAKDKMEHLGTAVCNVCGEKKKDVIKVEKSWFTSINICDSCGHQLFIRFKKDLSGKAED